MRSSSMLYACIFMFCMWCLTCAGSFFESHSDCLDSHESHRIKWAWLGGLSHTGVDLKLRVKSCRWNTEAVEPGKIRLLVKKKNREAADDFPTFALNVSARSVSSYGIADIYVSGLEGDLEYEYLAWVQAYKDLGNGLADIGKNYGLLGSFRTAPLISQPSNFSFAFASCADNRSNHLVFDAISDDKPLFFIHMGDIHYGNIEIADSSAFHYMFDMVFDSPRQARMFRNMPVVYMFDDHDFGPNNAEKNSPSRNVSIHAFLEAVPSYPLSEYSSSYTRYKPGDAFDEKMEYPSTHFAFTIARVRFIVTDTSSLKVTNNRGGLTALGIRQLRWLCQELTNASKTHGLVVWVTTMPWLVQYDKWAVFVDERKVISETIRREKINEKLIMLSGDAHMLAVDDGSNVLGSFPVFQAAALDAKPTSKGGPYSHGIIPGRGQYGWIDIQDNGVKICVLFNGLQVDGLSGEKRKVLHFNSCNASANSLHLGYYPSPVWVQMIWKSLKKELISRHSLGNKFAVYVDSLTVSLAMLVHLLVAPIVAFAVLLETAYCLWLCSKHCLLDFPRSRL